MIVIALLPQLHRHCVLGVEVVLRLLWLHSCYICCGHCCPIIQVVVVIVITSSLSQLLSWPLLALSQPSWSCHCCRICGGACIVTVVIMATVGEALPAANAMLFPAEGATGLASNLQAWLREP